MLKTIMTQLSSELDLKETLSSTSEGIYDLKLDADLPVTISDIPGGFMFHSFVAPFPKNHHEESFATVVMRANLFAHPFQGIIFGLTHDGKTLTLSKIVDYEMGYPEFKIILEEFLNSIDFWRKEALKCV